MEINVLYDNLAERQELVAKNEAQGLRMLHDDFDPKKCPECDGEMVLQRTPLGWYCSKCNILSPVSGTMTFTDKPGVVTPIPEPLIFDPLPGTGTTKRLSYIEEFLRKCYPKS